MTEAADPPDIAAMSFEEALEELEAIVRQLEGGRTKLDEAINAYQRGASLKLHCEAKLGEAKAKVEQIAINPDGSVRTETQQFDR
jgi:exodeoxyribonuclease VII small subunit